MLKVPLLFLQLERKPNALGGPIVPKQQGSYRLSEIPPLANPPFVLVKILCWSRLLGPNLKDRSLLLGCKHNQIEMDITENPDVLHPHVRPLLHVSMNNQQKSPHGSLWKKWRWEQPGACILRKTLPTPFIGGRRASRGSSEARHTLRLSRDQEGHLHSTPACLKENVPARAPGGGYNRGNALQDAGANRSVTFPGENELRFHRGGLPPGPPVPGTAEL